MNYIKILIASFVLFFATSCGTNKTASPASPSGQQKIDLYAVYQKNCPACKMMKQSMQDPQVKDLLSKEFNLHTFDIRDKESLPKAWMRPVYSPTFYFLGSDQKELISSINAQPPAQLLATLKRAIEARDLK